MVDSEAIGQLGSELVGAEYIAEICICNRFQKFDPSHHFLDALLLGEKVLDVKRPYR